MTMPTLDQLNKAFDQLAARESGRDQRIDEVTESLKRRSVQACLRAIGKQKTMRLDKKTTITGTIVEARFHGVRVRSASVVAQFKIVLECGPAKSRREFICEILPS